jgi:hypothetical protein
MTDITQRCQHCGGTRQEHGRTSPFHCRTRLTETYWEPWTVEQYDAAVRVGYAATSRVCNCGSGLPSRGLYDARGIYCGRICGQCEARVKGSFRPEIFTDPNYYTSEPVEEDDD